MASGTHAPGGPGRGGVEVFGTERRRSNRMRQAVRTRGSMILALGVVTALGVIPLTAEPVRAAVFPVIVVPKPKPKPKPPTIHRPPPNNGNNGGMGGGTPPGGGGGPPPGGQNAPEPA